MNNKLKKSSQWPAKLLEFPTLVFIGLTLSLWFLIFYPEIPPFWDYPPHLSRLHILKLDGTDPIISQYFSIDWHYIPNLALDLFAYLLLPFFEADTIMRIFICVGIVIGASGTIYLHRTLGGRGLWPYIVFLFFINDILAFGFLSFLFTNGLAVWFFAFWVKSRKMNFWIKLCLFTPAAMVLLTSHFFGFCTYALLVGSYEIAALIERYKAQDKLFSANFIAGALQFLPSFILFFMASETSSSTSFSAGQIMAKLSGLASIISLYNIELQMVVVAIICLYIAFTLIKRKSIFAPRMYVFAILSIIFFLIAPGDAFGSFFLDRRMPIAFLFPFIASIQFKESAIKTTYCRTALIGVCLIQYIHIGWQWTKFDRVYDDMFEVTHDLKAGDRLLHFVMEKFSFSDNLGPPFIRFPEHLLVSKGVISPFVFADPRHQPIQYHGPVPSGAGEYPSIPKFDTERLQKLKIALDTELSVDYDYLLLTDFDKEFLSESTKWQFYSAKGIFSLYKKTDDING